MVSLLLFINMVVEYVKKFKDLEARRFTNTEYSCRPRRRAQHGHRQQSRGRATVTD